MAPRGYCGELGLEGPFSNIVAGNHKEMFHFLELKKPPVEIEGAACRLSPDLIAIMVNLAASRPGAELAQEPGQVRTEMEDVLDRRSGDYDYLRQAGLVHASPFPCVDLQRALCGVGGVYRWRTNGVTTGGTDGVTPPLGVFGGRFDSPVGSESSDRPRSALRDAVPGARHPTKHALRKR